MNTQESKSFLEEFPRVFESLRKESDRGCVLVVGALLENALEVQINARLLPKAVKEKDSDELMSRSANSPISSFSAKINLAYRLGIFPLHERKIYHHLRELRNVCAHHIDTQNFDNNHFKDRIKNMINESEEFWNIISKAMMPRLFPDLQNANVESFVNAVGWRVAFEFFFSMVIAHKKISINRVARLTPLWESAQI